ncbi:MAG: 4Fe-4S binding protein [Eubacteriales bacterium]|nr:4Fe-4S binding protein [Eubacteriales bacterium]
MKHVITAIRILFLAVFVVLVANGKMMLWLALYAVSLLLALLFGRVYCGYACPMNTLMIPTEWLSKKLKWQTDTAPKWLRSGKIGWVTLLLSVGFTIFAQKILHKNIPVLLIWLAISVLVTLRYKTSVFHNLICPFGPLQKVFGKHAIFSERVDKKGCIGCKICEKVCPTESVTVKVEDKKAEINTALCLQCTNCKQVCPKNVIDY